MGQQQKELIPASQTCTHSTTQILLNCVTNFLLSLWKVAYLHHTHAVLQGFLCMDLPTSLNNQDNSHRHGHRPVWFQQSLNWDSFFPRDFWLCRFHNRKGKTHIWPYTVYQRHKICLTYFYISNRKCLVKRYTWINAWRNKGYHTNVYHYRRLKFGNIGKYICWIPTLSQALLK